MAAPANRVRGEVSLTLANETYRLRPTFEALVCAEDELGSLIALVERASSGDIRVKDITVLLHACAVAGGHDVSRDAFAQALLKEGIGVSIVPLRTILGGIMGVDGQSN